MNNIGKYNLLKDFMMSVQQITNMTFDLPNQISNPLPINNIIDFEKYKKYQSKYKFLTKLVESINKTDLLITLLVSFEVDLLALFHECNNSPDQAPMLVNNFKMQHLGRLEVLNFLINEVKRFPLTGSLSNKKNQARLLKIEENQIKNLEFINKRFNEIFNNYLKDDEIRHIKYIDRLLNMVKITKYDTSINISGNTKIISDGKNIPGFKQNTNIEFLNKTYFIYNSIDPSFIDERIKYFINTHLAAKLKGVTEEQQQIIKRSAIFARLQLRYENVLEKLA